MVRNVTNAPFIPLSISDAYDGSMTVTIIDETHYAAEMENTVLPALEACMTEGWMKPATTDWDGKPLPVLSKPGKLHYFCYDVHKFNARQDNDPSGTFRGAVVISHGFTEFGRKYSEMVWYFLKCGYSVCVFEHRGHGHSTHDMANPSLVWIDDWRRYVADFATFAQTVGREYAAGLPMNLYCHSMGGGIGAAVLERYPSLFDKAVLSAPMIAPVVGMPTWIARIVVGALCAIGFGKARVFGHTDFSEELNMDEYRGASEARIRWFHEQRKADSVCQTNAATFQWANQAMALSRAVLKPEMCGAIETPTLLFQARLDVWVLNEPQDAFIERVREGGGTIEKVRYDCSLHEIFSMPNNTIEPYLRKIIDFLNEPTAAIH